MANDQASFRRRLISGERLIGAFVKTPAIQSVEILADVGYDFVVLDEEHAALDRASIDVGLLACRASGTVGLVRVSGPASLLGVLDCGATGVLVPHIATAAQAQEAAGLCRYRNGRRGYSGSPRVGGYGGRRMWDVIDAADSATVVIAQIEDPEALENIDGIAATPGIDALFIGRADLAVAMHAASPEAAEVQDAVLCITAAARRIGKPVCVFVATAQEVAWLEAQGATTFVVSSDQGFMRTAASQALDAVRNKPQ